jgi:hypothetical protein
VRTVVSLETQRTAGDDAGAAVRLSCCGGACHSSEVTRSPAPRCPRHRNDPDHLLGRPNGYASKVSFTDSRVDQKLLESQRLAAIDGGGSVEVYPDADGAARRAKDIQDLQRAA